MYQAFYDIAGMGDQVTGDSPIEMELADVYTDVFPFMKEDGDFFGLIDTKGTTLQALYHAADDTYWLEVPRPDLNGSFGAYLTFDEASDLIKSIDGDFPLEGFSGFRFNGWSAHPPVHWQMVLPGLLLLLALLALLAFLFAHLFQ
jgi:hypothetical protein